MAVCLRTERGLQRWWTGARYAAVQVCFYICSIPTYRGKGKHTYISICVLM